MVLIIGRFLFNTPVVILHVVFGEAGLLHYVLVLDSRNRRELHRDLPFYPNKTIFTKFRDIMRILQLQLINSPLITRGHGAGGIDN